MAGLTTALVAQFKADLFLARHDFTNGGGHASKLSLFKANASITGTYDKTTTTYSTTDELATGGGYTAGGAACTNAGTGTDTTSTNNIGYSGFSGSVSWPSATFTTRGCSAYNTNGASNRTVFIYDFGADQTVSSGTFTVNFPSFAAATAIIRIT
jgi:hypothetical protein